MSLAGGRRAVFLDRDGVLTRLVWRNGAWVSPQSVDDFQILPGAPDAVGRLRAAGLLVFVVTNQPDIARGLMQTAEVASMHERLAAAVPLDEIVVCPHDDADGCQCRKPQPGMILSLAHRWGVDLGSAFVVGDSWKDLEAGRRAGCQTILVSVGSSLPAVPVERIADTLAGAVDQILGGLDSQLKDRHVIRS